MVLRQEMQLPPVAGDCWHVRSHVARRAEEADRLPVLDERGEEAVLRLGRVRRADGLGGQQQ